MKKVNLVVAIVFLSLQGFSQLYIGKDKSVKIKFFSETPVENISATNESSSSIFNTSNDSLIVRVPINAFVFPKSLMQEHFNENYMESKKYPNASFRGKVNEKVDYKTNGENKVSCTGNLTIHGVSKPVTLTGTLKVEDGKITIDSKFAVKLADYKIDVPKIVFQNIAEDIQVTLNAAYSPYVKK